MIERKLLLWPLWYCYVWEEWYLMPMKVYWEMILLLRYYQYERGGCDLIEGIDYTFCYYVIEVTMMCYYVKWLVEVMKYIVIINSNDDSDNEWGMMINKQYMIWNNDQMKWYDMIWY